MCLEEIHSLEQMDKKYVEGFRCLNNLVMVYILSDSWAKRASISSSEKKNSTKMLSQILCELDLSVHFLQLPRRLLASQ